MSTFFRTRQSEIENGINEISSNNSNVKPSTSNVNQPKQKPLKPKSKKKTTNSKKSHWDKGNGPEPLLEEKKITLYQLDSHNYDLQTIDVMPYRRLQSHIKNLLTEKKDDGSNNRSQAYEDLKKEITSPEFKEKLREAIKASERDINNNNVGSDSDQPHSLYKVDKSKLASQTPDLPIFNYEGIHPERSINSEDTLNDIENDLKKHKVGYLIRVDDYVLVMIYTSQENDKAIPIMRIDFNDNLFEKIQNGQDSNYSDIYKDNASGKQYIKDANGVFVPRYVTRYLSDTDDPVAQGLKSRNGKRPEGTDVNSSLLANLHSTQQETSYYISCTKTQRLILDSDTDLSNPFVNGQVVIDLSKIKQANIYDVHGIPDIMEVLTSKELNENPALRDPVQARELLIHEEVPKDAIVQIRKQNIQEGNWVDFQKEYNGNSNSEAHKYFIDSEFSRWINRLLKDSPDFKNIYYENKPFSQEFINKLTANELPVMQMKQMFVEEIQRAYRNNGDKIPAEFLSNLRQIKGLVADYELIQVSDIIQQNPGSDKLSLIDTIANRRLELAKHYLDMDLLGTMWQTFNEVIDYNKATHRMKKLIDGYAKLGEQYLGNPITMDNIVDYGKSLNLDSLGENENTRAKRHEPTRQIIETFNQALEKAVYIADLPHSLVFDNKNIPSNIQNSLDSRTGLSWIIASAFEKDGWTGIDRLSKNLEHISQQKTYDAEVFQAALADFHTHVNEAQTPTTEEQQHTLKDICQKLGTDANTTMYKLAPAGQTIILVARVDSSGKRSYLFAGPSSNGGLSENNIDPTSNNIVVFRHIRDFETYLNTYFTQNNLIQPQVGDTITTAKFDFTLIQRDQLKNIPIQFEKDVFIDPHSIWKTPVERVDNWLDYTRNHAKEHQRVIDTLKGHGISEAHNSIKELMPYLDFSRLLSLHKEVLQGIKQTHSVLDNLVPAYPLMKERLNGDLSIPFVDSSDTTKKTTWIEIKSTQKDLIGNIKKIQKYHEKVQRSRFQSKYAWASAVNQIDDFYGFLAIANEFRALIFEKTHTQQQVLSVYLNSIISKVQLGVGTGQIISVTLPKVHQYLSKIKPTAIGLSSLGKGANIASKIGKRLPLIGLALEAGNIGVNIYDLTKAQTNLQKASAITQIGLGATGAGITAGMLAASALGAAAVAGALTGAGLLLIPIGLLVESIFSYCNNVQSAEETYRYLGTLARAYKKGYEYKDESLTFVHGAVVTRINLKTKQISLGSQSMVSPTTQEFRIGGRPLYYRGKDTLSVDILQAMKLNYHKDFTETISTLILPITIDQELEYTHAEEALYPNKQVDGDGNQLIDGLRNYGVRTDWTDTKDTSGDATRTVSMSMNGIKVKKTLDTRIEVILDKQIKHIYAPKIDSSIHNKLTYVLQGDGGQYTCTLADKIALELTESNDSVSTWIINSEKLDSPDGIIIEADKLIIGGVPIKLSGLTSSPIIIQRKNGDVCTIDLQKKEKKLTQMNYKEWLKRKDTARPFDGYTTDTHVIIKDYMNGTQNMGNAYYDVNNKQIFFSSIPTQGSQDTTRLLTNAHLGTLIGNEAYWSNTQEGLIWRTNAQTGAIQVQYLPQRLNSSDWELKNIHFEQLEGLLYVKQGFYSRNGPVTVKWHTYRLHDNKMELVADYTDTSSHSSITSPVQNFTKLANVQEINYSLSPLVKYYDTTDSNNSYWLRDGKDRIEANLPIDVDAATRRGLVYLGSIKSADQSTEMFYFYDSTNKKLYQQEEVEEDSQERPKAKSVSNKKVENAYLVGTSIRLTTEDGLTYLINNDRYRTSSLQIVEEAWLKTQGDSWLQNLNNLLQRTKNSVLIKGLQSKETNGQVFASYEAGKLVILDLGTSLTFVGVNHTGEQAYLFDFNTGKLYQQKIPSQTELPTMFNGYQIKNTFSKGEPFLPTMTFKSVTRMDDGRFHLVTKSPSNDSKEEIELLWDSKNNQVTLVKVTQHLIQRLNSNTSNQQESGIGVLLEGLFNFFENPLQLFSPNKVDSVSQAKKNQKDAALLEAMLHSHSQWKTNDVILISGDETISWYHIGLKKIVGYEGITKEDQPEYLGTATKSNQIRVFISTKNGYRVETYNKKSNNKTNQFEFSSSSFSPVHLKRLNDKTLLIKGQLNEGIFSPSLMDKIDCVVLQPSDTTSKTIYHLTNVLKDNVKSVIIDHYKTGSNPSQGELIYTSTPKTKFGRYGEHLCITDDRGTILIRNIFGNQKDDYNQIKIRLSDKSYLKDIAEIATSLEQAQQLTRYQSFYNLNEFASRGYLVYEENGRLKNVVGSSASDVLNGNELSNKLYGLGGPDVLRGYGGNDELDGGQGNDIYQFTNSGQGHDIISDIGGQDSLEFLFAIQQNQFTLERKGDSLSIWYDNRQSSITIKDHFISGHEVESMKFINGSTININSLTQQASTLSNQGSTWSYSMSDLYKTS